MRVRSGTGRKTRDLSNINGPRLRSWRVELGLSRKDMSEQLGISRRTLEALESGSRPITLTIARLAWYMVSHEKAKRADDLGRHPAERRWRELLEDVNHKLDRILANN